MTYSEQPTEPKTAKAGQSNSLFFQVLFVFSLCVLAYVIIQKSTNEVSDKEVNLVTQTVTEPSTDTGDVVTLIAEPARNDDVVTVDINPATQDAAVANTNNTPATETGLLSNVNTEQPITPDNVLVDIASEEMTINSQDRIYTVLKGDILGKISQKMYGSVRYMNVIQKANGLIDIDSLREGMELKIPAIEKKITPEQVAITTLVQTGSGFTTHTVSKGDTVWDICEKYYGSGAKQKWLKEDNPEYFGIDDAYLSIGIKLKIRKKSE